MRATKLKKLAISIPLALCASHAGAKSILVTGSLETDSPKVSCRAATEQRAYHNSFQLLEKFGAKLRAQVRQRQPKDGAESLGRSYRLGLMWGFLPCGLVYGVLLTTLFANDALQGGLTLLGFGLGTLPAMILTGSLYQHFRSLIRALYVQLFGGFIFIQGGLLIIFAPYFTDLGFMRAYPQLMSTMFCIS